MGSHSDFAEDIGSKADAAFLQASWKVIKRARDTGTPIIIWEDGQLKKLSPDEMEKRLRMQESAPAASR